MRYLDLLVRFAFFAIVPFLGTFVSTLFPMTPVLVNVGFTLVVFAAAEAVRERMARFPILARLLKGRLAFEEHYRAHPPRLFPFYVFYPLLLPYVLIRPDARRELLLYRGLGAGGVVILVAGAAFDFFWHWQPQIGFMAFLPRWIALFLIQTLAIFLFMMPAATTVVKLHLERRFAALWVLLVTAAISVTAAVTIIARRHKHTVSWVTLERVKLRTEAAPEDSKAAEMRALRAVWANYNELRESTDDDGWVEGEAFARAEAQLATFYKPDEAYAFSLYAFPPAAPETLVLQCQLGRRQQTLWVSLQRSGQEVTKIAELPGAAMGPRKPHSDKPLPVKRPAPPKPEPARPQGSAQPQASAHPQGSAQPQASAHPPASAQPQASARPQAPPHLQPSAQPTSRRPK